MNYCVRISTACVVILLLFLVVLQPAFAQTEVTADFGPPAEPNTWEKFTIPITAEAFGLGENPKAFNAILSNVAQFKIVTEMSDASDIGAIDEVSVGSAYFSDFTGGTESWSTIGDGTMEWVETGGFESGFLQVRDWASGILHYAVAPASWSGNWSALIGQNIDFYFKTTHPDYKAKVVISSDPINRVVLSLEKNTMLPGEVQNLRIALVPPPAANALVSVSTSDGDCVEVTDIVQYTEGLAFVDVELFAPETAANCQSVIEVTTSDYEGSRITVNVGEREVIEYGNIEGLVTDALSGDGVPGAIVTIGDSSTITDATGFYSIKNIPLGTGNAEFTAVPRTGEAPLFVQFYDGSSTGWDFIGASKEGYYNYSTAVFLASGDITVFNITMSPSVVEGGMRFVLSWGGTPLDLDLYLDTPIIEGSDDVISWQNSGSLVSAPYAALDRDDMDGFGPETITAVALYDGTYRLFVDNYSNTTFVGSLGQVQIYDATGLLQTVQVPTSGDGKYWYIGDVDGLSRNLTIKNEFLDAPPGGTLLTTSLREKPEVASIEAAVSSRALSIVSWAWDFDGDGLVDSNQRNPEHTYDTPGVYTVSLTVSDGYKNYTETKIDYIRVFTGDDIPPGEVIDLTASAINTTTIDLTWSNPTDADFMGTSIMRRTDRFPESVGDGTYVYTGTGESFRDSELEPNTTYFYSAFARDGKFNWSGLVSSSMDSATTFVLGTSGLRVNISSFDISAFPDVKAYASVVDSVTLEPVKGLTESNFTLFEDKTLESPIDVKEVTTSSDAAVDIVFVFDVTGSMGSYISGLKNRVIAFADSLDSKGIDYRLGLVAYDDTIRTTWDFTYDATQFKDWVSSLVATGGGDTPENALEGLARAASYAFRPEAQNITILITDASYHELGGSGQGTTSFTTETMVNLLISKSIVNHVVGPNYNNMHYLSEETGGLFFYYRDDFQGIIDLIGNIISNQYIVSYTTHNPVVDNTWRQVNLKVQNSSKAGQDMGRYFIGDVIDNVSYFYAYGISSSQIICRWSNPADTSFSGVIVSRSSTGYPSSPSDGLVVYSGKGTSFMDTGLDPNSAYYYSAFTFNLGGIYSDYSELAVGRAVTFDDKEYVGGWTRIRTGADENLRSVVAVDSNYVVIVGERGKVIKSRDSGASWYMKTLGDNQHTLLQVAFPDTGNGAVLGHNATNEPRLWGTEDGGATWEGISAGTSTTLYDFEAFDDNSVWTVGANGLINKINPLGGWTTQTSGVTTDLYAASFVNSTTGWVVGDEGVVLKTNNGGKSWEKLDASTSTQLFDVFFINDQTGWMVNVSGEVFRTANGGNTWTKQKIHSSGLLSIHFSDPLNGYTVGAAGGMFSTKDGGATWTEVKTGVTVPLRDVFVLTPYLGWAVGDGGVVLKLVREDDYSMLKGLNVNISSIDAESFPGVKAFASVTDSDTKRFMTGLTKDNFIVSEEGTDITEFKVEELTKSSGAKADIAFVFDVTGSMGDEINSLKARALSFADALASKGIDYRLGLVTYDDDVLEVHDFTADASEFKSWIEGLRASGGGDTKENSLEALERSVSLSWRAVTQRIGILITDADYHEAGETGGGTTDQTTSSMITLLSENAIVLNTVAPDYVQFHELANETGGLWFNINGDFGSIVDDLGELISSQYVITYTTPNPMPDNKWRKVDVVVQKSTIGGHDTGTYFVGASRIATSPEEVVGLEDDVFTVNVFVENVLELGLVHFFVNYDAAKVEILDGTVGDFLKQGGASATSVQEVNNATGKTEVSLTRVAPTGASGTGVLYSLRFHIKVPNCTSNITLTSVDLRKPDNTPITVTVAGTSLLAAGVPGGFDLVGDFDDDLDIDIRDFALLATYWKPANTANGDIGPAEGTVPTLTPVPDGKVNFEDLFVFTRMWNWFNETRETLGGGLGKGFADLSWRVADKQTGDNSLRLELWANSVERLTMGHMLVEYDNNALKFKSAQAGDFITKGDASSAFFVESNSNQLEISLARLPQKGQNASVSGSGVVAVFEFERENDSQTPFIKVKEIDLRANDNSNIAIGEMGEFTLSGTELPTSYSLSQNYPNPFNNRTQLEFSLPKISRVRITIMNVLGQPVRTLAYTDFQAGTHRVVWDGKNDYGQDVAGGIYLIQMEAGSFKQTREMLFLK